MDRNPYSSPPETPYQNRPVNLLRLVLATSLVAALGLVCMDAPRWLVVAAGAAAVLAADQMLTRSWES